MQAAEIIETFKRNSYLIRRQAAGLSHADSLLQPEFRANCFNWILGHVVANRDIILGRLDAPTFMTDAQVARYDYDSAPILTDGDDVIDFEQLLAWLDATEAGLKAALEANPEKLATVYKTNDKGEAQTFEQMVSFLTWHDSYHTGQFELLRQLAGTNDHII